MSTGHSLPLTLKAGLGFETGGVRRHVDGFIVVDASLPAGLRAPLHVHERAYFTLILRGGFEEHYGPMALTTQAGTMNFVPAGTPHRTLSHGAQFVRIEFPDAALALATTAGPVLRRPAVFTHPTPIALARRVAAEVRSREHGWRLVVQGLLMELLGHVVRDQAHPLFSARTIPRWLRDVKERLDADWHQPLSLDQLARSAGVHPVHLARAFRASYGSSVGGYRRARQLKAAEDRLLRSEDDLRDVALSCGFADQSHFSKAFRRAFGIAPGRYRRALSRRR
jgi:AraC family transcriptional regulator